MRELRLDLRAQRNDVPELDWATLQLELGMRGQTDLLSLWECAKILEQHDSQLAPQCLGVLARELARCGANRVSQAAAETFERIRSESDDWLAEQIAKKTYKGAGPDEFAAWQALAAGRRAEAIERLHACAARPGNARVAVALAELHFAGSAFEHGADLLASVYQHRPESNWQFGIEAACGYWLAGNADRSIELLQAVRAYDDLVREVDDETDELLRSMSGSASSTWVADGWTPGPATTPGGDQYNAVQSLVEERFLARIEHKDNIATLWQTLEASSAAVWRVRLKREQIAPWLDAGLLILLAEERPAELGLAWLRGHDTQTGIVAVSALPDRGVTLRSWQDQQSRSRLHGMRALVIAGDDRAADTLAVSDDSEIAALDACYADDHGDPPPRTRVVSLAERAVTAAPDLQEAWMLKGNALLAQLEAGELPDSADGPFEEWYANVRDRFDDAEWASQIYAQALEYQGRDHEAAIMWTDALYQDDEDYRNHLAVARLAGTIGVQSSLDMLREALCLHPGCHQAWTQATRELLTRDDLDRADFCSSVAVALAADDGAALLARGDTMERRGQSAAAEKQFRRATGDSDLGVSALSRLSVHAFLHGNFRAAADWAGTLREDCPDSARGWVFAELAGRGLDTADEVFAHMLFYSERHRVADFMIDEIADFLTDTWTGDQLLKRALAVCERLVSTSQDLNFARAIARRRPRVALAALEELRDTTSDAINWQWSLAQVLLRLLREPGLGPDEHGELTDRTSTALLTTIEYTGEFAYPRLCYSWIARRRDPARAREILDGAVPSAPAPAWWLAAQLADLGGDDEVVRALEERLDSLQDDDIAGAISLLRDFELHEAATALATRYIAQRPECAAIRIQGAISLATDGGVGDAASWLPDSPEGMNEGLFAYIMCRGGRFELAGTVAGREAAAQGVLSDRHIDPWPLRAIAHVCASHTGARADPLIESCSHRGVLAVLAESGDDRAAALLQARAPGLHQHIAEGRWWWT